MNALINIKAKFRRIPAANRYIYIAAFVKIASGTRSEQNYCFNPR